MKKTILTLMLTFLIANVFAVKGNGVKMLSYTSSDGLILETIEKSEASVYVFESGTQSVGYKYFMRAEIHNDYGIGIEANSETCFQGSKKTLYSDHVILKIDSYGSPKVYWSIESSVLKIFITR